MMRWLTHHHASLCYRKRKPTKNFDALLHIICTPHTVFEEETTGAVSIICWKKEHNIYIFFLTNIKDSVQLRTYSCYYISEILKQDI